MAKLKDLSDNGVKMYGFLKSYAENGLNQSQAYAYIGGEEQRLLEAGMLSFKYDRATFNQDWSLVKAEQAKLQAIQSLAVTDVLTEEHFSQGLGTFKEGQYQVQLHVFGVNAQTGEQTDYYFTYASDQPLTKEDYLQVGFDYRFSQFSLSVDVQQVDIVGAYRSA